MAAKSTNTKKMFYEQHSESSKKVQQLRKHRQRKKASASTKKSSGSKTKMNFKSYKYSTKSGNPFRDSSIGFPCHLYPSYPE